MFLSIPKKATGAVSEHILYTFHVNILIVLYEQHVHSVGGTVASHLPDWDVNPALLASRACTFPNICASFSSKRQG